jgi:putative transposase
LIEWADFKLMSRKRWIAPWAKSQTRPSIYHCVSRVVDRRYVFKDIERENFRMFMRMYEKFSGCRVLSYCVMSNHFHLLLEAPPMPAEGISDEELLKRLGAIYTEAAVAAVAAELMKARDAKNTNELVEIHARYTYRMHDLSEFMKTLLQRFTRWFNRTHDRSGTLWEERYKSVLVESGTAARTIAAYIDLNPVRAGMVEDPADYRWSSYGEAIGGGTKGNGKKAREGLIRACFSELAKDAEPKKWDETARVYRRLMGIALEKKLGRSQNTVPRKMVTKNAAEMLELKDNETILKDLGVAKMLRCRLRYFTEGAVIGSKEFVNEAFESARERFGEKRKTGARKLRGEAAGLAGLLWSARDLKRGI